MSTHDGAERRPFPLPGARPQYGPDRVVRVEHIDIVVRPDLQRKILAGEVTHRVRAIEDGVRRLRLDAVDLEIDAVRGPAGEALAFRSTAVDLTVDLAAPLAAGDVFAFTVAYRALRPRRGIYFIDAPRQVWTQSQDTDARAWLPCFDHPAEKQTTSTTIVVERGLFALGNGALVARDDGPETTTFRYEQAIPHATYLLTLVAGTFVEIAQTNPRVPTYYYVVPGREDDGARSFGNTPRMIDAFEATIGVPYPYARYSQIAVAEFIFGGMENTAATTQTDRTLHDARAHLDFSSDPLVSHELAHQWFGDLVTCRDWSQAWLNEGFATYFEAVWAEADLGWDEYQRAIFESVARYLDEDEERYRRPIVCNVYRDPVELFDRHLYEKGAAVLHLLRGELGWERMRRSLRRYVTDNATKSVETIDLVRAIEAETGRNLRGFFEQWIERGGHPELEVRQSWDEGRALLTIEVEQKQPIDDEHPAYVLDLDLGFGRAPAAIVRDAGSGVLDGERRVRVRLSRAQQSFAFALEAQPELVRVDPSAWILGTIGYALGTEAHATILRTDPSPVARIRAAQALGKDGSRTASEALGAVLASEPFWGVAVEIAAVLGKSRTAAARDALLDAAAHAHPKVRAAVASALGTYRDTAVADALLRLQTTRRTSSLGRRSRRSAKRAIQDRSPPSSRGWSVRSWNETVAAGAAHGLAELADARALDPLLAALAAREREGLRRAAAGALARLSVLVEGVRSAVVDALERALDDRSYFVRLSTYAACEKVADARLLDALDRRARNELDGRLRRDAAEAAIRVREAAKTPAEVVRLREELDRLRDDVNRLARARGSAHRMKRCAWHRALAAICIAALTACGGAQPGPTEVRAAAIAVRRTVPSWSPGQVADVQRKLRAVLGASALATSGIAILGTDAQPLFLRRDRVPYAPASTFKLLVAASALETFGPEYRFETTLEALDAPRDGTIAGDVYLVGNGDPTLRRDDLDASAGALAHAGVQRITGAVVADGSAFGGPEVNAAWDPGDLQYGFAAGVSALSVDEGTVEFHIVPRSPGVPAQILIRPPNDDVRILGGVTTGYATTLSIDRAAASNTFTFAGSVAVGAEQSFWRPLIDQPRYAGSVERSSLVRRGIDVVGTSRAGVAPLSGTILWRHRSKPLREILSEMLFESDNHEAEQLLRALGTRAASVGTALSGGTVERAMLRRFEVPEDGLRIVDGSGLAATDRIAALSLATLLARSALGPNGPVLIRSLPRVGIEGTVRRRDLTTALGRARAKSGHIEDVNALAGYVQTHSHGRVAFAIIVNDRRADDGPVDDGIDRTLDVLAAQ